MRDKRTPKDVCGEARPLILLGHVSEENGGYTCNPQHRSAVRNFVFFCCYGNLKTHGIHPTLQNYVYVMLCESKPRNTMNSSVKILKLPSIPKSRPQGKQLVQREVEITNF